MAKHRAEDTQSGKSSSEQMQGPRNDASQGKHRAAGETTQDLGPQTTPSDLPARGENL